MTTAVLDVVEPTDVYLVSFPRSGSTWVRCLVTSLVHGCDASPALVATTVPDVHRVEPTLRPAPPVVVKSHAPWTDRPHRVVYLARHGADAMLSYFDRQRRLGLQPPASVVDFLSDPDIWPCTWSEHVHGWLDGVEGSSSVDLLVVRYEDLWRDPGDGLARIAEFIGLAADADAIQVAVRRNDLATIRAIETDQGGEPFNGVARRRTQLRDVPTATRRRFLAASASALQRLGYS